MSAEARPEPLLAPPIIRLNADATLMSEKADAADNAGDRSSLSIVVGPDNILMLAYLCLEVLEKIQIGSRWGERE